MYGPKGVEQAYALQSLPRQQADGELSPEGCRRRTLTRTRDERSTPLGPMMMGARAFRGFAALTRGYRVVRPLRGHPRLQSSATPAGPAASRICCTDVGMRTAVSQRHAAGMATGTAAPRMRCTDIGMGTAVPPRHAAGMTAGTASLPRFCSGMATRKAAPRGPNYSVAAGEHGEPAEGEPHIYVRPQGGRTGIRPAQPATAVGRWRAATRGMPVHDTHAHTRRAFDPLGADDDGGTRLPRVRCAHPRLQSSATPAGPLRGRQLHGMPVQM